MSYGGGALPAKRPENRLQEAKFRTLLFRTLFAFLGLKSRVENFAKNGRFENKIT
jgi:hypothetical protein